MSGLDWKDPAAVRHWLVNMRVAVDDMHAVTEDMLRPKRKRRLGHVQHCDLYHEAHGSTLSLLDYALGIEPEPGGTPSEPCH